jgi:hypothetical protein
MRQILSAIAAVAIIASAVWVVGGCGGTGDGSQIEIKRSDNPANQPNEGSTGTDKMNQ